MSGITAATAASYAAIAGGIAGVASLGMSAMSKTPKAPAPAAAPPVPTVNDAKAAADTSAAQNTSKGMLANMLNPIQAQGSTNQSLKTLLGQ